MEVLKEKKIRSVENLETLTNGAYVCIMKRKIKNESNGNNSENYKEKLFRDKIKDICLYLQRCRDKQLSMIQWRFRRTIFLTCI